MAQFCNCARIVLAHALLLIFGKASIRFFEVVDSGSCLDSEKLDSRFCFCESWLDSVGLLSLTTKRSFFRKLVIAVWLCKFYGFFGRLADKPSVPSEKSATLSHCKSAEPFSCERAKFL